MSMGNVSGAQSLLDPVPSGGGYAARAAAALVDGTQRVAEPMGESVAVREPAYEAPRQWRPEPEPMAIATAEPAVAAAQSQAYAAPERVAAARHEPVREAVREEMPVAPKPEPLLTPVLTEDADPSRPARKGWWQRKFSSD